jgi:Formyl transferase, C-terminal domain
MWQAYTPWPGIYTMYEGKRLLLEGVAESSPPEKGESEGVTQKRIHNNVTHPNLSLASLAAKSADSQTFSGKGPNSGTVIKLQDGKIGVICGK